MRTCSFDGCGRKHDSRGLCKTHIKQLKEGRPLTPVKERLPDAERFWSHVDKQQKCWLWTSEINSWGYARFNIAGGRVYAHRHAYEILVGTIPEGFAVAHQCRNKICCNPEHLFLVYGKDGNTLHGLRDVLEGRIAELEKENAELRKKLELQAQEAKDMVF
jgi:hypothetical protein